MRKLALTFGVLVAVGVLAIIAAGAVTPGERGFTNEIDIAETPDR